jgi:hypothetical protein
MYFVVCDDKTYEKHYAPDIHAIKLECLTQLRNLRTPIVKFFEEDFPYDDSWDTKLEALAVVHAIFLVYVEDWDDELIEDKYYPTITGR